MSRKRALAIRKTFVRCPPKHVQRGVVKVHIAERHVHMDYVGAHAAVIRPRAQRSTRPTVQHGARRLQRKCTAYRIAGFASLAKNVAESETQIVRGGPQAAALHGRLDDFSIPGFIRFLMLQPRAQAVESMAHAWLVLPPGIGVRNDGAESYGSVSPSSAVNGVSAIASRRMNISEVMNDSESRRLCVQHNVKTIAAAPIELVHDDSLRSRIGSTMPERDRRRVDLRRQHTALECIYGNVEGRTA